MKKKITLLVLSVLSLSLSPFIDGNVLFADSLHPLNHCRIIDQRYTSPSTSIAVGTDYTFSTILTNNISQGGESSNCGVPSTATAIFASVVIVNPTGPGYLKIWPAGGVEPTVASALNFFRVYDTVVGNYPVAPGRLALIKLGTGSNAGLFMVSTYYFGGQLIVDVEGYTD